MCRLQNKELLQKEEAVRQLNKQKAKDVNNHFPKEEMGTQITNEHEKMFNLIRNKENMN